MTIEHNDQAGLREVVRVVVRETLEHFEKSQNTDRIAYTEPEAAALIGIPRHSLRDARLRGEIEASKIGRRIIYRREELEDYLARNQI
ncbi:MAG: helix-turn-helix domain-containing protein [Pirellulaceae bacterium]|jgi:hypothetical protein|nr:helix-turn-helix domain-containing protein [Pirellulaceae bacterium]